MAQHQVPSWEAQLQNILLTTIQINSTYVAFLAIEQRVSADQHENFTSYILLSTLTNHAWGGRGSSPFCQSSAERMSFILSRTAWIRLKCVLPSSFTPAKVDRFSRCFSLGPSQPEIWSVSWRKLFSYSNCSSRCAVSHADKTFFTSLFRHVLRFKSPLRILSYVIRRGLDASPSATGTCGSFWTHLFLTQQTMMQSLLVQQKEPSYLQARLFLGTPPLLLIL